jgi:hypothetical protein
MKARLGLSSLVLVLTAGLSVQAAMAGPQEDVAAATQKWATVFADNNPDTILPLYAKDVCCGAHSRPRYDRIRPR